MINGGALRNNVLLGIFVEHRHVFSGPEKTHGIGTIDPTVVLARLLETQGLVLEDVVLDTRLELGRVVAARVLEILPILMGSKIRKV